MSISMTERIERVSKAYERQPSENLKNFLCFLKVLQAAGIENLRDSWHAVRDNSTWVPDPRCPLWSNAVLLQYLGPDGLELKARPENFPQCYQYAEALNFDAFEDKHRVWMHAFLRDKLDKFLSDRDFDLFYDCENEKENKEIVAAIKYLSRWIWREGESYDYRRRYMKRSPLARYDSDKGEWYIKSFPSKEEIAAR